MAEQLPVTHSDAEQLRRYRELAKLLREWRDEPDDCDWDVIEAEINSAGMACREPELSKKRMSHAPSA